MIGSRSKPRSWPTGVTRRWRLISIGEKLPLPPTEAHEIMGAVREDRAARDLHAAVEFLKSLSKVKKDRIGSIGWCMGGGYSLKVALQEPTLGAAVINYGHLAAHADSLKKINAAVLGIFGGQDRGIPVDDVKQFEQTLKQQGNKVEIVISRRRTCLRESQQQDGLSRG